MALVAVGIFGTLLERRFGPLPVLAVFVLSGAAGMALVALIETPPLFTDTEVFSRLRRQRRRARPALRLARRRPRSPRAARTTATTTCSAST